MNNHSRSTPIDSGLTKHYNFFFKFQKIKLINNKTLNSVCALGIIDAETISKKKLLAFGITVQ